MASNRSRARALILSSVAVLCAVAAVEWGLRLFGVAAVRPTSRLLYQQVFTPLLAPVIVPDGTRTLATTDGRLPFQWVAADKPAAALRVFVFGGSATAGLGYSPNVTFARELERQLAAAYPERDVEVVNFGIVALASAQVLTIVRDAVTAGAPDWVIVYAGNNEFLELHSEHFAALGRNTPQALAHAVRNSRIARLLTRPKPLDPRAVEASISTRAIARSQERVEHRELMANVNVRPAEESAVFARYEANLAAMAEAARALGARVILAAPAVNWRWRGIEDRPANWIAALLATSEAEAHSPKGLARALDVLDAAVAGADPKSLWERLHERAEVRAMLGDPEGARADYRESMNADPHRRRALDSQTQMARRAAEKSGALHFDAVAALERRAPNGIVGFEHFYDYVHPTPEGCMLLAEALFTAMADVEGPPAAAFDLARHGAQRRDLLAQTARDFLDVKEFLGIGDDVRRLSSRDLWKADRCWDELDARIAADPTDADAYCWRGNFHFFQRDGAVAARADYERSLALRPDPTVESNLARLLGNRRPGR